MRIPLLTKIDSTSTHTHSVAHSLQPPPMATNHCFRFTPYFILHALLLLPNPGRSEPLLKSFTSCLSQYSATLAPPDQLINLTQLWTQLDTGQDRLGQLGPHSFQSPQNDLLRIALVGQVGSQSTGYSSQTNFLATLISETSVLNFQSFSNQSALCSSIRTSNFTSNSTRLDSSNRSNVIESGCPYGPGEVVLGVSIPISQSGYPLMTLSTQLQVLDTSTPALTLACIQLDTTPYYPSNLYYKLLLWVPIGIVVGYLLVGWSGRIWAAIISEQLNREAQVAATMDDPFRNHSNLAAQVASVWWLVWSGQGLLLSGALLRFSTPATRDIFNHLQFITLLGLFSVQWPEFAYPIFTQTAWTTLAFNSTFVRTHLPSTQSIDPLNTPNYQPPPSFASQFDTLGSPLYLNRTLPNVLLNFENEKQGIPRWAMTIGILPRDIFGVSIATFALISCVLAAFSALAYLFALTSSLISLNRSTKPQVRDSPILNNAEIDDGTNYSPRSGHDFPDRMKPDSHPEKNSLDYINRDAGEDQAKWPEISRHFALLQGNLLRLFIIFYLPIVVFASHQLTLFRDASKISVVIAAISLLLCAAVPIFHLYRVKKHSTEELIDNYAVVLALGPLYNTYDDKNQLFMGVRFTSSFMIGVAIGAGQSSAMTQSVVLLVAELTETMLTSLWLPWGDGAAMAPLTFILSVSRIIAAIILVVLTPTVSVGSTAAGWLTYVILLLVGSVLAVFLGVLIVKLVELLLRLFAHVPFDETRSTRAGGLRGAFRRWDRTTSRSTRHGRAAAIAARRRRRLKSKSTSSTQQPHKASFTKRNSVFSALNGQSSTLADNSKDFSLHPHATSPGFVTMNDDDGNIMSAMSQGPWLRAQTPETTFITSAIYPNSTNHPPSHQPITAELTSFSAGNPSTSSSGFAVVRGGRASEKTPYQMHNDGRNTWRPQTLPSHANHHYPPIPQQGPASSSDLQLQNRPPPGPSFYQVSGSQSNASRTTTNLFENTSYQHSPNTEFTNHDTFGGRMEQAQKSIPLLKRFNWSRRRNDENTSSEDDTDDTDGDDEEIQESLAGTGGKKGKLKGIFSGLEGWRGGTKKSKSTTETSMESNEYIEQEPPPETRGFHVVRQPRPRPSPVASSSNDGKKSDSSTLKASDGPSSNDDNEIYPIPPSTQPE